MPRVGTGPSSAPVGSSLLRAARVLVAGVLVSCGGSPTKETAPDPQAAVIGKADASTLAQTSDPEKDEPAPDPAPAPPREPFGPLTEGERAAFFGGEEEVTTPVTPDTYVQSNETRHDLWFPYIADLGGGFIGVGSDPSYTLIAVQKAEYAYVMDVDWRVVDLHRVYRVFILAADTPRQLVDMWHADRKEEMISLIEREFAELPEERRKKILRNFKASRETVYRHLERVIARKQDGQQTSWLSNQAHYDHVRTLYRNDRIRLLDGDLTGPTTMLTIGKAAAELGEPIMVFYLSNAEEYFDYTKQYAANVANLPAAANSLALRTIYNKEWEHAGLWNYQVQPLADYQTRVPESLNRRRNHLLRLAELEKKLERTTDVKGLSRVACGGPGCTASPAKTNGEPSAAASPG